MFLKPEDQATSDYLLRIYRVSIPHLPKTALKFGQDLQLALQPMIIKPSPAAGINVSVCLSITHCGAQSILDRGFKKPWRACALWCKRAAMTPR